MPCAQTATGLVETWRKLLSSSLYQSTLASYRCVCCRGEASLPRIGLLHDTISDTTGLGSRLKMSPSCGIRFKYCRKIDLHAVKSHQTLARTMVLHLLFALSRGEHGVFVTWQRTCVHGSLVRRSHLLWTCSLCLSCPKACGFRS